MFWNEFPAGGSANRPAAAGGDRSGLRYPFSAHTKLAGTDADCWRALGLNTFLQQWSGVRTSLLGIILAFLIYFPLYLLRGMGAGDVKLMAAIGAIVGPANWFGIFIVSALLGGIAAAILLLARGRLANSLWNIGFLFQRLLSLKAPYAREELDLSSPKSVKMPHGVAIAAGTAIFLAAAWKWAPR